MSRGKHKHLPNRRAKAHPIATSVGAQAAPGMEQNATRKEERPLLIPAELRGEPVPPTGMKLLRNLYRIGLLLFVLGIMIVFRGVLLPFMLAVLFAYLIFPIVALIQRIPFGGWRYPRWLAILTVYAVLFTVGFFTLPKAMSSFAGEIGQLQNTLPQLFSKIKDQRTSVDAYLTKRLSVKKLPGSSLEVIKADLENLRLGRPFTAPTEFESLAPPAEPTAKSEADSVAGAATSTPEINKFQLFGIDVHLYGDGKAPVVIPSLTNSEDPPQATESVESPTPEESPASTDGSESQSESTVPPFTFTYSAQEAFNTQLTFRINQSLEAEGPAKDVEAHLAGWIDELNAELLHIAPDNPRLSDFKKLVQVEFASVILQENYAQQVMQEIDKGIVAGRTWLGEQLSKSLEWVFALGRFLWTFIFETFLILMLTAFFLIFYPTIHDYVRGLVPPRYRDDYETVIKRIDVRLGGAVRGQVIICLVNGILTYPGLYFIGSQMENAESLQKLALLLSVVAGILSMIPIFGVILSTIPMVLIAWTGSFWAGLAIIAWISGIHALEAYVLNPNIIGHSAKMNPIIVIFALLAGKQVGGLVGALLGVPIASVIVALFGHYRRRVAKMYAAEAGTEATEDNWGD